MTRIDEATSILRRLGLPTPQCNERSALVLLALAGIGARGTWPEASNARVWRTVDIMECIRADHGRDYAANTRETIRRQTLHQFEQAGVVDRNPDDLRRATNSGKTCYRISPQLVPVLRAFDPRVDAVGKRADTKSATSRFDLALAEFHRMIPALRERYRAERQAVRVPVGLPEGYKLLLSPGAHNELQKAIVEQFAEVFAPQASVLYIGDTADRAAFVDEDRLGELGIKIAQHEKLPDVVLYMASKRWLFMVEAVTSHGPVSSKRRVELAALFPGSTADRVYVTAFGTRDQFRKHAADIAWETEVWIADEPTHLIHFDGHRFMGPH